MDKSLTIDKKTRIIIFWDKAKLFLTEFENTQIEQRMLQGFDGFQLNQNKYKFNDISKWITVEEYYKLYPQEQVEHTNYTYKPEPEIPYSAKRHFRALTEMRRGFLKHWEGRELNKQAKVILECMNKRIKNFKIGDKAEPAKIFFGIK